jgi:hypothetical protein
MASKQIQICLVVGSADENNPFTNWHERLKAEYGLRHSGENPQKR